MSNLHSTYQLPAMSSTEIIDYLSSPLFKGIGKKTAITLVEHFGTDILNILDTSPHLLAEIPGLKTYRIDKINQAWSDSKNNPVRGAIALLLGIGTSFKLTLNICARYGIETEKILKTNPYQLVEDLERVGFKTADKLARSLGITPDSPHRYFQAVLHTLSGALSEGHCFLPLDVLIERTEEILTLPEYQPDPQLLQTVINEAIETNALLKGAYDGSIYLAKVYASELKVANSIKQRLQQYDRPTQELSYWLSEYCNEVTTLSPEQRNALLMAEKHGISILTGGPGRGKTYVLRTWVKWLQHKGYKIALAAPTGKAANRMKDSTGVQAMTIHRLLKWQGASHCFEHNQQNPLLHDWIIIDEFSMVDIFLFNSLLKALKTHCKILLVGDKDQLPSIGAGMVLRDLLVSEVLPTTELTTIFRQDSGSEIVEASTSINYGQVPKIDTFTNPADWLNYSNCSLLETNTPTATARAIASLVKEIALTDVDLSHQLVVLAPQKKSPAGVHNRLQTSPTLI
ncbi:MAG: AAA family ATPase [Prochloraceae cyanobacterium]|nr:AAA family ATPase [Prochloraceae cyanobacterium]